MITCLLRLIVETIRRDTIDEGSLISLGYRQVTHSRSKTASDSVQRDGDSICDREPVLVWSQILYCQGSEIWINAKKDLIHLEKVW